VEIRSDKCVLQGLSLTQPATSSEYRGDDAGIKQVFHFLKIRSEIRGPNFHGPSLCISFKTRRTWRPYAVVFPVCAVSLVRRALVAVMANVLTNLR